MIRLKPLIPLTECVIATLHIGGETFLAKNRDRKYNPDIEIIHELIDDIECVYIHDKLTDWSEGMNEFGIGIVNSSLLVHYDEIEADVMTGKVDFDKEKKGVQPSYDGLKIRTALSKYRLSDSIHSIIKFRGKDKKDVGVKGMTMISDTKHSFVIELTSAHLPVIKKIDSPKVTVRSNHGIAYPEAGYTEGMKRKSSVMRMQTAQRELEKVTDPAEILNVLKKKYHDNPFLNPYRTENKEHMHTTGQVLMNLSSLQFTFRPDQKFSKFSGYKNRLPKSYTPKIQVNILEK